MTLEALLDDYEAKAPRFNGECVNLTIIPGKGTCRVEVRQPDLSFKGVSAPTMREALILALTKKPRQAKPKPPVDDLKDVI